MKKTSLLMAIAAVTGLAACTAPTPKADLKTDVDSLSYAIGMARTQGLDRFLSQNGLDSTHTADFLKGFNEGAVMGKDELAHLLGLQVGYNVANQWIEGFNQQIFGKDSTQTVSRENMLAGFIAGVLNDNRIMQQNIAEVFMRTKMDEIKEKQLEVEFADNKEAGEKFLAENKTKEGVQTTESGLQYKILTKGNGVIPADSNRVLVNYRGTLIDGTEFDSSDKRKDKTKKAQPAKMRINQLIKGWGEAITMMPVGSKWELYIPYNLAYGSQNRPPHIKPFSALIFEVELVGIDE